MRPRRVAAATFNAQAVGQRLVRAARSDAAQIEATLRALEYERELAKVTLISKLGLDVPPEGVRLAAARLTAITTCGTPEALITDALASRPDVRAAEIGIEAAAGAPRNART